MYTVHGWHIPFTFLEPERPENVVACGGVRMCPTCTVEAMPYMPAFNSLQRAMLIEHAQKEKEAKQIPACHCSRFVEFVQVKIFRKRNHGAPAR